VASVRAVADDKARQLPPGHRWSVRPVRLDEFEPWSALFRGYADFYRWDLPDTQRQQIWSWIHEEHLIEAFVAVEVDGSGVEPGPPVGLAHVRTWVRPLRGSVNGYLDDLFVAPDARGSGVVDAIFRELHQVAAARGWPLIRWTTAVDNRRAQHAYDRHASRTAWVTYDMDTPPGAGTA